MLFVNRSEIPYEDLKKLGIPPPPEGHYMTRYQVSHSRISFSSDSFTLVDAMQLHCLIILQSTMLCLNFYVSRYIYKYIYENLIGLSRGHRFHHRLDGAVTIAGRIHRKCMEGPTIERNLTRGENEGEVHLIEMILLPETIRIGKIHHTGTEEHPMEMFLLTRAIKIRKIHCRGDGLETERIGI